MAVMAMRLVVPMRWASPGLAADGGGDGGADADGQADRYRDLEEADGAGEADRGRDGLLTEAGDVEEVEQVDREDGDQADGAGQRHDGDVAHDRAGQEAGRRRPGLGGHGHLRQVLVRRPKRGGSR
jgi:hypothetical protein